MRGGEGGGEIENGEGGENGNGNGGNVTGVKTGESGGLGCGLGCGHRLGGGIGARVADWRSLGQFLGNLPLPMGSPRGLLSTTLWAWPGSQIGGQQSGHLRDNRGRDRPPSFLS